MKKYTNIIFGVLGILIITNTFLKGESVQNVFGYDMNIWVYRGIWFFITLSSLYEIFFKKKREED